MWRKNSEVNHSLPELSSVGGCPMRYATLIALTLLIVTVFGHTQTNSPKPANSASTQDADSSLIQQIELDWLKV